MPEQKPRLKHFAAKLRETRATLGLKQEDLAIKLGDKKLRSLIARWESPLEKNRSFPKPEYLKKIAELTPVPWQTLCWFLNDGIQAGEAYEIYPDGTFDIFPPLPTDEEVEAHFEEFNKDMEARHNPKHHIKELTEKKDFKELIDFYENMGAQEAKALDDTIAQIRSGLVKTESIKDGLPAHESFDTSAKHIRSSTQIHKIDPIEGIPAGRVEIQRERGSREGSSMIVRAPLTLGDLAPGPNFQKKEDPLLTVIKNTETAEQRATGLRSFREDRENQSRLFWNAVQYQLQDAYKIEDVSTYFERQIHRGEIKQRLHYFDGIVMARFIGLYTNSSANLLKLHLKDALSDLFMAERLANRSYKKLVLAYCPNSGELSPEAMQTQFSGFINSASMLNVSILFSCGMTETAATLGDFLRNAAIANFK